MAPINRRFSTGVPFLDRRLDGGIQVGSLLALVAPATSQSEVLLHQCTGAQTFHYVSTTCPNLDELEATVATHVDRPLEGTFRYVEPDEALASPESVFADLAPESYLILDTVDPIERTGTREEYLGFLNTLKRHLREKDAVGILHCLDGGVPQQRRALTQNRADHVWQLQQFVLNDSVRIQLAVTKARRGRALSEPVPLILTDRVRVDTSKSF